MWLQWHHVSLKQPDPNSAQRFGRKPNRKRLPGELVTWQLAVSRTPARFWKSEPQGKLHSGRLTAQTGRMSSLDLFTLTSEGSLNAGWPAGLGHSPKQQEAAT